MMSHADSLVDSGIDTEDKVLDPETKEKAAEFREVSVPRLAPTAQRSTAH